MAWRYYDDCNISLARPWLHGAQQHGQVTHFFRQIGKRRVRVRSRQHSENILKGLKGSDAALANLVRHLLGKRLLRTLYLLDQVSENGRARYKSVWLRMSPVVKRLNTELPIRQ